MVMLGDNFQRIRNIPDLSDKDIAKFKTKVDTTSNENGCQIWIGYKNYANYGFFCFSKQRFLAHRVAYLIANGQFAPDLHICHTCDNPACVNPTHLFAGTHQDNMADAHKKGKFANNRLKIMLNDDDIAKIKALKEEGLTQLEISKIFNIRPYHVWSVLSRAKYDTH